MSNKKRIQLTIAIVLSTLFVFFILVIYFLPYGIESSNQSITMVDITNENGKVISNYSAYKHLLKDVMLQQYNDYDNDFFQYNALVAVVTNGEKYKGATISRIDFEGPKIKVLYTLKSDYLSGIIDDNPMTKDMYVINFVQIERTTIQSFEVEIVDLIK